MHNKHSDNNTEYNKLIGFVDENISINIVNGRQFFFAKSKFLLKPVGF